MDRVRHGLWTAAALRPPYRYRHQPAGILRWPISRACSATTDHDAGSNLTLVMSHLACADEPAHPLNARQRDAFAAVRAALARRPGSLANSSGIFLGADYCHDLVRPGHRALWRQSASRRAQSHAAGRLISQARSCRLRDRRAGRDGRLWRDLGGKARVPHRGARLPATRTACRAPRVPVIEGIRPQVYLAGRRCPIIGRISMDMMAIDVDRRARQPVQARHPGRVSRPQYRH